jgi:hypothetical protein
MGQQAAMDSSRQFHIILREVVGNHCFQESKKLAPKIKGVAHDDFLTISGVKSQGTRNESAMALKLENSSITCFVSLISCSLAPAISAAASWASEQYWH